MNRRILLLGVLLFALIVAVGCTGKGTPAGMRNVTRAVPSTPTSTPIPLGASVSIEKTKVVPTGTERALAASPTVTATVALGASPTSTYAPTPTLGGVFGVIVPLKLRVHEKPGIYAPVSGYLDGGDVVEVLGRDSSGSWLYVSSRDGRKKGWVSANYVNVIGNIGTVPKIAESPVSGKTPPSRLSALKGRIFYVSGWGIYAFDVSSGGVEFVTGGIEPAVSPNGEWLAFVRGGGEKGLWVRNLKNGEERRIFGGFDIRTPRWASDGNRIYFSVQDETRPAQHKCIPFINRCWDIPEDKRWHLAEVTFPEGEYTGIPSDYHSFAPNPLRDGKVLYQNERGLAITALDSAPEPVLEKPWTLLPWVRSQEDEVAVQYRLPQGWVVAMVRIDGSGFTILTKPDPLSEEKHNYVSPSWSPDGRHLAMLHNVNDGKWEMMVTDFSGNVIKKINPSPSPEYPFDGAQAVVWGN